MSTIKTTKEQVEKFIDQLKIEAEACEKNGFNLSASSYREKAERLQYFLDIGIIPQLHRQKLKSFLNN